MPFPNKPKSLNKRLTYLLNHQNVNKPRKSSLIKISLKFKIKTINLNPINNPNSLCQTKPYKRTDSKFINAPNNANKPFKNSKSKSNFKSEKNKNKENYLRNKSKKKINELSNSSTKSSNKEKNSKKSGNKEKLNWVSKLISGTGSESLNSTDSTTGNLSKIKTAPKPKLSKTQYKKSCFVMQVWSCLKIFKLIFNTNCNVSFRKWTKFMKEISKRNVLKASSSNSFKWRNKSYNLRYSTKCILRKYLCLNGKGFWICWDWKTWNKKGHW